LVNFTFHFLLRLLIKIIWPSSAELFKKLQFEKSHNNFSISSFFTFSHPDSWNICFISDFSKSIVTVVDEKTIYKRNKERLSWCCCNNVDPTLICLFLKRGKKTFDKSDVDINVGPRLIRWIPGTIDNFTFRKWTEKN